MLDSDAEALLITLIEAARTRSHDEREPFDLFRNLGQGSRVVIQHPGLPNRSVNPYEGDFEQLDQGGFLRVWNRSSDMITFEIAQRGYQHYTELHQRSG